MRQLIYFLVFATMFSACGDQMMDDMQENMNSANDLSIVTGINFYDANGAPIGTIGNPNTTTETPVEVYPNPPGDVMFVFNTEGVTYDMWIVPAEKDTSFASEDYSQVEFDYSNDTLDAYQSLKTNLEAGNSALNLENFVPGYYRIITKDANGTLSIENTYINPSLSPMENYQFLLEEF